MNLDYIKVKIKLKWYKRFLNNLVNKLGFSKLFKDEEDFFERIKGVTDCGIGFRIKEREGNMIKDIDLYEVSLTSKMKENEKS